MFSPTPYEWPRAYFDIQYLFSKRLVELGIAPDISTAVLRYTTIYRRLYDVKPSDISDSDIAVEWTSVSLSIDNIWLKYISNQNHLYSNRPDPLDGCHYGSFIYKPYPGLPFIIDTQTGFQKIELHFNNHRGNGKSEYSRSNADGMAKDLHKLFQSVSTRMQSDDGFNPKFVTLVSWMNNFPGLRQVMPKEFVESGTIAYPAQMTFNGDSLWGQFLTNAGGVNQQRSQLFLENIQKATDLDGIVSSFPIPVIVNRAPISIFFDKFEIK